MMTGPQISPISQLLHTLGITREDLMKRSNQMRQFLTADDAMPSRVFDHDTTTRQRSGSDIQSSSRSVGSSGSLARSLSRASSSTLRDGSPPTTPVKSEPHEISLPHRRVDSMEMVLERQRRQLKKSRREHKRESSRNRTHQHSPSPSNASQSGTSAIQLNTTANSQSGTTQSTTVPVTPQKSKYYREHTNLATQDETPTPTRQALTQYYAYMPGYAQYLPMAYRTIPVTPQAQRTLTAPPHARSPLPSSSPPPVSSPMSSPARRVVNLVSSPGPMGPDPRENECDNLPYKLPPGPYLTTKPDLSYAALIGRAILSSPEHRLTLQEIYDWITIVYPYYKRGETTWMNSIRHVLSTTVVFRKVPRDRSVGRTLWAIYDEDLECFKDGGFKKHFCKDYINSTDYKEKGKGRTRKRADDDDGDRKAKKSKRESVITSSSTDPTIVHSSFLDRNNLGSRSIFPGVRPTHLQPYYQSCIPQPPTFTTIPADVIFPPLPASAAFSRIVNASSSSTSSVTKSEDESNASSPPTTLSRSSPAPSSSITSAASSVPELTPNRNSSSPPSSTHATSDIDVDMHDVRPSRMTEGVYRVVNSVIMPDSREEEPASGDADGDAIFNTTLLGPVKFWRKDSPRSSVSALDLLNFDSEGDAHPSTRDSKSKKKVIAFPPIPTSPTLSVRAIQSRSEGAGRPNTPLSSLPVPSTPPRTTHRISSIRTPLSHKGLNMSPATSLAHYKSNLDPPPAVSGGVAPLEVSTSADDEVIDLSKTPRKRTNVSSGPSIYGLPMTPKKLNFSSNTGESPFRTPRWRMMYDPNDPRAMLDDELNRSNTYDDSPAGLFGKERSSLLYDSPGVEGYKWW